MTTTMFTCPRNHQSETADFCSVCGIEMPADAAECGKGYIVSPLPPAEGRNRCPECGAIRASSEKLACEICGFNFQTQEAGVPEGRGATPESSAPAEAAWEIVVTVDANLFGAPEPKAPVGQPPQVFMLFEAVNLIGRPGAPGDVRVHVPISMDEAISRRQALLTRQPDGSLTVRDLGSANGTFLNGKMLTAGVDMPIRDRDVIGVGAWTRIEVRKIT